VTWTVDDVVQRIPQLGIPHFQRGLVWGNEAVAALLESLFYETPCGSFVLWAPKDCASRGVPIDPSRGVNLEYLVIDGQQRMRSLYSVFTDNVQSEEQAPDGDGQDDASDGQNKVWCINLPKAPGYSAVLKPQARDFALFVYTADPAKRPAARQSPLKHNVLPLQAILNADSWSSQALAHYVGLIDLKDARVAGEEGIQRRLEDLYQDLRRRALGILGQTFFVSIQRKDDLAEMASLYNRINSGGKRVDVEERAFARLVGLQANTYDELAKVFRAVHGARNEAASDVQRNGRDPRDEVLQRQKERAFGFKLFIRVFLQVCQHHFGLQQSRADFSFEIADKTAFVDAFRTITAEQNAELWTEARRVLEDVRGILRDELYCDDLRSLPETTSLTPIFQLLINYPQLSGDEYRSLLAGLCLRLALGEPDSKTLGEFVYGAGSAASTAFKVIPKMVQTLDRTLDRPKLLRRLEGANSIQSRYVLLLYWLERRLKAQDFRYARVGNGKRLVGPERMVEQGNTPEKQHLLPFNQARALYPGDLRRGGSHRVNSIGNLTYISQALNSWDGGLGDSFADLGADPLDNQRAHFLVRDESDRAVLDSYEDLRKGLGGDAPRGGPDLKRTFDHMTARRRELIAESALDWLREIDLTTCQSLKVSSLLDLHTLERTAHRLEPAAPRFTAKGRRDVAHQIRELELSHDDADRLIALTQAAGVRVPRSAKGAVDILLTKKRKRVWVHAQQRSVALCFATSVTEDHRARMLDALGLAGGGSGIGVRVALDPVPDFQALLKIVAELRAEIEGDGVAEPAVISRAGGAST